MDAVMDYVLDARHLPQWSFFTSAEPEDDHWRVTSAEGGATLKFVALHEPGTPRRDCVVSEVRLVPLDAVLLVLF